MRSTQIRQGPYRVGFSLVILFIGFCLGLVSPIRAEVAIQFEYQAVQDCGDIADLRRRVPSGSKVIPSEGNPEKGYIIRSVKVTSETQLLRLMGVNDAGQLSDVQKGLFEAFRMGSNKQLQELQQYGPQGSHSLTCNLVDTTGLDEEKVLPEMRRDFWPYATKTEYGNGDRSMEILMSGANAAGKGAMTPTIMMGTFTHEFGHTLDKTSMNSETDYGPDQAHFSNEIITEKAAFAEGFANFVSSLFLPERIARFRQSLKDIQIEGGAGDYQKYSPHDPTIDPKDLLRVEGIVTLVLYRIATTIPDGKEKLFSTFSRINSYGNTLGALLQAFIHDNPHDAEAVAAILDEETFNRLSDEDLRAFLGNGRQADSYIRNRTNPGITTQPVSTSRKPSSSVSSAGKIYRWRDQNGKVSFSDSPPPAGVPYTVLAPNEHSPEPTTGGKPIVVIDQDLSPFGGSR